MKKALFVLFLAGTMGAQAQQKLIGQSLYYYDNTGATQYIDSSSYDYPDWQGSLYANEPVFGFDDPIFDWTFKLPLIHCGTETTYSGNSLPLTTSGLFSYTISGGNVTKRESSFDKTEYTYDANGNTIAIGNFYFDGTNWVQTQNETSEYDANGNLVVHNIYEYPSGSPVHMYSDTLDYNTGNQLIEARKNVYDETAGQWVAYQKSVLTYSGIELSNIQLFEGDLTTPLEQTYDIDYTYLSGKPVQLEGYEVIGGQPQTPALVVFDYTYGANQKISVIEGTFGGDLMEKRAFTYDNQGFVTKIETSDFDFSTSMLYVYKRENYYYASTAGLEENELAQLSVYPNPVQDVLTISTTETIENVKIFAANGKIMIEQNTNAVNVSTIPAGTYVVVAQTASGVYQSRFVKN